jgi:hypothetical protein
MGYSDWTDEVFRADTLQRILDYLELLPVAPHVITPELITTGGDLVFTLRFHASEYDRVPEFVPGDNPQLIQDWREIEHFPTGEFEQIDTGEVDNQGDPIYTDGEEIYRPNPRPSYDINSVDADGNPVVISQMVGGIAR